MNNCERVTRSLSYLTRERILETPFLSSDAFFGQEFVATFPYNVCVRDGTLREPKIHTKKRKKEFHRWF